MPGIDADTGHSLVIAKAMIILKFMKRKIKIRESWNKKEPERTDKLTALRKKIEEDLTNTLPWFLSSTLPIIIVIVSGELSSCPVSPMHKVDQSFFR